MLQDYNQASFMWKTYVSIVKKKQEVFSKQLASLGNIYVNDAWNFVTERMLQLHYYLDFENKKMLPDYYWQKR
jgi:hypothetical protein